MDFIVDTLSATDDRAQLVDFVYPGFYSAGVSLYTSPEQAAMLDAAGGWDGLTNLTVCVPGEPSSTGSWQPDGCALNISCLQATAKGRGMDTTAAVPPAATCLA